MLRLDVIPDGSPSSSRKRRRMITSVLEQQLVVPNPSDPPGKQSGSPAKKSRIYFSFASDLKNTILFRCYVLIPSAQVLG